MVFRRRESRPFFRMLVEAVWPRGGWARAVRYLQLRLRRLPGTPEEIARGIFAGVFVVFTPLFGLHFLAAAILAKIMQGRILAAMLATFVGNPLTYVPIAVLSLRLGYAMLGLPRPDGLTRDIFRHVHGATHDLWRNFKALFTSDRAEWGRLIEFWDTVFFPWMVGSILPGVFFALIAYYLALPVIRAYQIRRMARLQKKMEKLKAQSGVRGQDG